MHYSLKRHWSLTYNDPYCVLRRVNQHSCSSDLKFSIWLLVESLVMTITCGCLSMWNCREKAGFFNYFAKYPSYDIFSAAAHRRKMSISQAASWILAASWFQVKVRRKGVPNLHLLSNFLLSAVVSTRKCRVKGSGGRQWSGAWGQDQQLHLCPQGCAHQSFQ